MKNSTFTQSAPHRFTNLQTGAVTVANTQSYTKNVTAGSLVKGNWKAPNPWSYVITAFSGLNGRYIYAIGGGSVPYREEEGQLLAGGPPGPWFNEVTLQQQCYNTTLEKLNERVRGSMDLASSLAEGGQTAKMLNLVKRLEDVAVDMRNSWRREIVRNIERLNSPRRFRKEVNRWQRGIKTRNPGAYKPIPPRGNPLSQGVKSGSSALANGWCEYTYGLNPLISDIRGAAENVLGYVRKNTVVSAKVSIPIEQTRTITYSYGGWTGPARMTFTGRCACEIKVLMNVGYDDGLSKWTSLNPLSVAYELTPYSFVLDWAFDLGSYLRAVETALLYNTSFRGGFTSQLTVWDSALYANGRYNTGFGDVYTIVNAKAAAYRCIFQRSLLINYPHPELPSWKVDLGSNRLLSAAALLRQLLR